MILYLVESSRLPEKLRHWHMKNHGIDLYFMLTDMAKAIWVILPEIVNHPNVTILDQSLTTLCSNRTVNCFSN